MYKLHKCEWDESSKEGHIFCWICNNEIPYTNMNKVALVDKLLDELNNRGGFDGWWGNLDEEIQLEIRTTLTEIIRKDEK